MLFNEYGSLHETIWRLSFASNINYGSGSPRFCNTITNFRAVFKGSGLGLIELGGSLDFLGAGRRSFSAVGSVPVTPKVSPVAKKSDFISRSVRKLKIISWG